MGASLKPSIHILSAMAAEFTEGRPARARSLPRHFNSATKLLHPPRNTSN